MNKPICLVSKTILKHTSQAAIFLSSFLYVYLKSALVSNTRPLGTAAEEGAAWNTKLGCKTAASSWGTGRCQDDVQQVKGTEAGRAGWAGISSINPSKDAGMGPYCIFCDNPTYFAQKHRTGPELEGTLEVI